MLLRSVITLLISIVCWSSWAQSLPYIDPLLLIELLGEIKQQCPPQECIYVGVGRSPTLLTSSLRLQEGVDVIDLPLSGFRYVAKAEHEVPRMTFQLPRDKRDVLFAHFDNYFPAELAGKRIMLIDFSVSGSTIASTHNFLEVYFNQHRKLQSPPELSAFILFGSEQDSKYIADKMKDRGIKKFHQLAMKNSKYEQIYKLLYDERFDNYSRGGEFKILEYHSVGDYKKRWVIDSNLQSNRLLQRSILDSIVEDPELEKIFPIGCSSYYL